MSDFTTNIRICKDANQKTTADVLGDELDMCHPNEETVTAILEAEMIAKAPSVKGYTDLDELFDELRT